MSIPLIYKLLQFHENLAFDFYETVSLKKSFLYKMILKINICYIVNYNSWSYFYNNLYSNAKCWMRLCLNYQKLIFNVSKKQIDFVLSHMIGLKCNSMFKMTWLLKMIFSPVELSMHINFQNWFNFAYFMKIYNS